MQTSDVLDAVQRELSPVLDRRGFLAASVGWHSSGAVSILYCTDAVAFATQWPHVVELLRRWNELEPEQRGRCLDLVIEASPAGEVLSATFESVDLVVLLRAAGHDEVADRCARSELGPLEPNEVAARLTDSVEALLPA